MNIVNNGCLSKQIKNNVRKKAKSVSSALLNGVVIQVRIVLCKCKENGSLNKLFYLKYYEMKKKKTNFLLFFCISIISNIIQ